MQKLSWALAAIVVASTLPAFGQSTATTTRTMPSCPGDTVVWENTKTKAYHMSGDTYYGTTKHGRYACKAAAEAAGFHAAGMHSSGTHSSMKSSSDTGDETDATPAPTASGVRGTSKHHRRHRGMASPGPLGASPNPSAT